jgi:hypothetical protein
MIFRKLAIFVVIFSTKKLFLNPYLLANVGHIWNCCKVTNQKTGVEKNFYIKPKQKTKKVTKQLATPKSDILEGQMSFQEIKKEPQPIQSIFSKVLNKFKS